MFFNSDMSFNIFIFISNFHLLDFCWYIKIHSRVCTAVQFLITFAFLHNKIYYMWGCTILYAVVILE